jgi:hypothetical protein
MRVRGTIQHRRDLPVGAAPTVANGRQKNACPGFVSRWSRMWTRVALRSAGVPTSRAWVPRTIGVSYRGQDRAIGRADDRYFWEVGRHVIFTKVRDPRLVTVRRGGSLQDRDHHLLGVWAADCATHVLHFFEEAQPADDRPRRAIELIRAWARGEITSAQARAAPFSAHAAAREVSGAAREAAHAAGQALAVAHVAAHELGAAAYAIRAVRAASRADRRDEAGRSEREWQRAQLPAQIRELVLDDQRLRNEVCWSLFEG